MSSTKEDAVPSDELTSSIHSTTSLSVKSESFGNCRDEDEKCAMKVKYKNYSTADILKVADDKINQN
jgi:hypothetical protein